MVDVNKYIFGVKKLVKPNNVTTGLGLVNRYSGSVILVSSRAVNRLTDVNIN